MDKTNSPCVRNCCLNEDDICLGCFRSLEEIVGWGQSTEERKREVLKLVQNRRADHHGGFIQRSTEL